MTKKQITLMALIALVAGAFIVFVIHIVREVSDITWPFILIIGGNIFLFLAPMALALSMARRFRKFLDVFVPDHTVEEKMRLIKFDLLDARRQETEAQQRSVAGGQMATACKRDMEDRVDEAAVLAGDYGYTVSRFVNRTDEEAYARDRRPHIVADATR